MAEIIGVISGVVGILSAAELAYQKLKSMKGLPEAFAEVALRLPLAQQILRDVKARSQETSEETAKAIFPVVESCKGNAEALKKVLEDLDPGQPTSAWNLHVDKYISLIRSRGKKGRVEDLMKKILEDLYTLASHQSIKAASSEQLESLKEAIEKVGQVKQSVPDEMLEDGTKFSISHGGHGPMMNQVGDHNEAWTHFGSGHINNISGDAHFGATTAERRRNILRDLNCASYEDQKDRNPEAMPSTCVWFTEHPTFQSWIANPREKFLWVSADPGCGKSVLAKHMIDHELKSSKVIYFFFKDGLDDQDNAESALKCLLHQLLKDNPNLFTKEVLKCFEELGEKRSKGFSSLWNIFAKVAHAVVDTICVVDALDECEASGWSRMAEALGGLCENGKMSMRFILFSRPYSQVRRAIRKGRIPHINLRGEDAAEIGKISAEINIVIRRKIEELGLESKLSFEEQEKVFQRLTKVSNRTYLWIHVICDMLETLERVENNSLESFLERLPETVEDAYNKILRQSVDVQAARKLLHIIVAATRPLSVEEMAMAIAVNSHPSSDGEFSVMRTDAFAEGMRNICGLFVVVVQGKIHLIHQTAREFLIREIPSERCLEWEASLKLAESHQIMMRICVRYLSNIGLRSPRSTGQMADYSFSKYAKIHVMFDYASRNWASHYQQSKMEEMEDLSPDIDRLCDTDWTGCMTWQTYCVYIREFPSEWNDPFSDSLKLASYFGIGHVVRGILAKHGHRLHETDRVRFQSALDWAATSGAHTVVIILLETRQTNFADFMYRGLDIGRALRNASKQGHSSIVDTLLGASRTMVLPADAAQALLNAAEKGHDSIIRSLLSSNIDYGTIYLQKQKWWFQSGSGSGDIEYRNPITYAAIKGHSTTIKILLESGKVHPDATYQEDSTALASAVQHRRERIVEMLLETGKVYVNSRSNSWTTPLIYAAGKGNVDVADLLLRTNKADVNARDIAGNSPLLQAGKCGNLAIVKLLLATGKVDTNARNKNNETPLTVAVTNSHSDVVDTLLSTGNIDEEELNSDVVSLAAENDDISMVKLLHEKWNIGLGMTDSYILDEAPIMVALKHGSNRVFEYLLDAGQLDVNCEFNWRSRHGITHCSTLLMRAAESGQLDIVRILLSRKANVNLQLSTDGTTALSVAVTWGRLDVLKTLLQAEGQDLSLRCKEGLTARLLARKLRGSIRRSGKSDRRIKEIICCLNDYIYSMPDGGRALQNLERSIIDVIGPAMFGLEPIAPFLFDFKPFGTVPHGRRHYRSLDLFE